MRVVNHTLFLGLPYFDIFVLQPRLSVDVKCLNINWLLFDSNVRLVFIVYVFVTLVINCSCMRGIQKLHRLTQLITR